jgi:cation transport ATPase
VGHAETFAERTVGPTLATAGLGLLVGDLTAATAILRPDYATGPGVAVPLETLRNAALCARRGIVARAPDVFERLAEVDCIVLEDGPALGRRALEVTGVQTHVAEVELLRSAASAFHHLADERAPALAEACRIRRAHLIDLAPIAFDPGVTVAHGKRRVRVRDYVASTGPSGPLVVEVDNTPVGLIHFGRSARLEAATAIARVRAVAPVPIVLVSNRPEADVSRLARDLGVDQHLSALSPLDMARFVESCRARGLRPAFVGDCRRHAAATAHAHTTISLLADANLDCDPADVLLLEQRLELFADLWETARSHRVRVRATQDWILVPNLVCVASAFLLGGTALTSVLISNLGTLGLYSRSKGALRALEPPRVRARLAQPA